MISASAGALGALVGGEAGVFQAEAFAATVLTQPEVEGLTARLMEQHVDSSDPAMSQFWGVLHQLNNATLSGDFVSEFSRSDSQKNLADIVQSMGEAPRTQLQIAALTLLARRHLPIRTQPELLGVAGSDGQSVRTILDRSQFGRMETEEIAQRLAKLKAKEAAARTGNGFASELPPDFQGWARGYLNGRAGVERLVYAAVGFEQEHQPLWSAQTFFLAGLLASQMGMKEAAEYFLQAGHKYISEDFPAGGAHDRLPLWSMHAVQAFFLSAQAAEGNPVKVSEAYQWAAQNVALTDPYYGETDLTKLKWVFGRRKIEATLSRAHLCGVQQEYGYFLMPPVVRETFYSTVFRREEEGDPETSILSALHLLDAVANGWGNPEENLEMSRAVLKHAGVL